jgi:hypothetical protein
MIFFHGSEFTASIVFCLFRKLSWKTKQLVADLKTLKTLMTYLTQYDSITFYSLVKRFTIFQKILLFNINGKYYSSTILIAF